MSLHDAVLLVLAGVGSGLVGYLTGLASLVSYPALLAVGLSPVAANVTNTLGVAAIGLGSSARARPTLLERGGRHLGLHVLFAAVGGLLGGALLLVAGEGAFRAVVPWLIALSSVLVLLGPQIRRLGGHRLPDGAYWVGLAFVCVYCGYFGAGSGTIYLALAAITGAESFGRAMVLKSALLTVANILAAVLFVIFGPVDWWAALLLGVGCLGGGALGPVVQRHLPVPVLRGSVAVAGLGLAVWLARG